VCQTSHGFTSRQKMRCRLSFSVIIGLQRICLTRRSWRSGFVQPRNNWGLDFSQAVMAGLVPAIHVLSGRRKKDVDARDKPGHDEQ
jgi:hypothetical protein